MKSLALSYCNIGHAYTFVTGILKRFVKQHDIYLTLNIRLINPNALKRFIYSINKIGMGYFHGFLINI